MKRCLLSKQGRTFSPEFKRSAASPVLDQSYSHVEASRSVGVSESVLRRRVQQLHQERHGITPQSPAMTPRQQRIQEPEARVERLEREKTILKNYCAADVGRDRTYEIIDQVGDGVSVVMLCELFFVEARLKCPLSG